MNEKLETYFENMKKYNQIGHAFLIGNETFESIEQSLNNIISKYIINEDIDLSNCSDVYIINPSGLFITKDQLKELQENLKTTSQVFDKKIYIINECEKLNSQAANSLLKILEEPERDIYAFLITSNINKVMSTIKSRCQILFLASNVKNENIYQSINEEELSIIIDFIKTIETKKFKSISKINSIIKKNIDKSSLFNILNVVIYFYIDCLNLILNKPIEYFENDIDLVKEIIKSNSIKTITKKIMIMNSMIDKINYNLNTNLLFDKIIIEFGRC